MADISNCRVAILATDGFERSELTEPRDRLAAAGAKVKVVSPKADEIRGWDTDNWGDMVSVDLALDAASVEDYDLLVLPGGQINPDLLRTDARAVAFVRDFMASGKTVGAICHGPWMLVEADAVRGRRMTSYHSIRTDVKNAGADWVDDAVVVDGNLITSRKPDDLPAFIDALTTAAARARA